MSKKFIITENERREIRKLYSLNEDDSLDKNLQKIFNNPNVNLSDLDKTEKDVTTDVPVDKEQPDNKEVETSSGDTQDVRIENGKVKIIGNFNSEQLTNINFLIDEMNKEGITDPYAQIGILSVIKKESGFIPKSEVSYSKTSNERLRKLFGKRLRKYSESELDELKKDDKQFYNVIYAKTVGNKGGDDGYNYRGRGFNQLTGIKNYEKYGNLIGMGNQLVENPDLVNDPKIAAKIALKFFTKGKSRFEFPKFRTKKEAAIMFADINAGGGVSSHRDSALKASENFEVVA